MADLTQDETIASLQAQLAALQKTHDDTVTAANAQTATLQKRLTDLQTQHDELEASSATEISALSQQLANATKAASLGYIGVTVYGKPCKIIGKKFLIRGKEVTAEDLAKDNATLEKLVDIGSGVVQEIS